MNQIRFGVIGLNRGRSFAAVCRAVGGATVTAIYDVDLPRAERAAAEFDGRAFGDIETFLAADIDAVVVASPVPYHAAQAIAALDAGKHVLSEVIACSTMDEARVLVRASRASRSIYMMAENYRYFDEIELVKRMNDDGRFGDVYYAEGEYTHDCRGLWHNEDGSLTWRGQGRLSVYGTHSLGPLLYITGDRVTAVNALAVPGGKFDAQVIIPTLHVLQMTTSSGATFRVRVDHVSPRPHAAAYYQVQGTRGAYEAARGFGDRPKVWLDDEHEPSLFHAAAQWHSLEDQQARYIPDRLAAPPEARVGGHGRSEYWLLQDFLAAIRGEREAPIDVFRALDYRFPASAARNPLPEVAIRFSFPIRGHGRNSSEAIMRLKDRVAIITGAVSGIGAGTAEVFAEQGARLMLVDRNCEALDLIGSISLPTAPRSRHFVVMCQYRRRSDSVVTQTLAGFGQIDIVFNNAGIMPHGDLKRF